MSNPLREGNSSRDLEQRVIQSSASPKVVPAQSAVGMLYAVKDVYDPDTNTYRQDGWGRPVKVFRTRAAAEEYLADLLSYERDWPLFEGQWLDDNTSMPLPIFLDYLTDLGLPLPPEPGLAVEGWVAWWRELSRSLPYAQRNRVREALDKRMPYRVFEIPLLS